MRYHDYSVLGRREWVSGRHSNMSQVINAGNGDCVCLGIVCPHHIHPRQFCRTEMKQNMAILPDGFCMSIITWINICLLLGNGHIYWFLYLEQQLNCLAFRCSNNISWSVLNDLNITKLNYSWNCWICFWDSW